MPNTIIYKRAELLLLSVGPMTTILVSPNTNFDPINLIKVLWLTSISFLIIGLIFSTWKFSVKRANKFFWILVGFFILAMISTLIFSKAPLNQQFWGTFGRSTGFLTYISLLFILVCSVLIHSQKYLKHLILGFIFTSVPITLYSLIQIAGMDPVPWSAKDVFATLGNANFLSAFLGMTAVSVFALALDRKLKLGSRVALYFLFIIQALVIVISKSIQGPMILAAGVGLCIYIFLRCNFKSVLFRMSYLLTGLICTLLTVLALSNKGPLAKVIYQPTILFRADYMHAGWKMTLERPFYGVGLDSYGDWYRTLRGSISTLRTSPDRTANVAHNIFLDFSSNGGFPLLLAYLGLVLFALIGGIKFLKKSTDYNPVIVALFCSWVAYQVQSLVSINQVGVGVWGWLFTGSLIGLLNLNNKDEIISNNSLKGKKTIRQVSLPPIAILTSMIMLIFGFLLSFIPFSADMKYKSAIQTSQLDKMILATEANGSTLWHLSTILDKAVMNNFETQARDLDLRLIRDYPRDFYGWKVLYTLNSSSPEEKAHALRKLRELDPYNPQIPKS